MPVVDPASRSNNFNLLRLILASLVLLSHAPELIDGDRHRELATRLYHIWSFGELAVNGFFLLSGYLIARSWDHEPKFWSYLLKRVRRIVPGFIVASLVSCLIIAPFGTNPNYWRDFRIGPFLAGMLLLQMPWVPDAFPGQHYVDINGALWTISYEFACYMGLAFLGLLGLFRHRPAVLLLAIAMIAWQLADARAWIPPSLGGGHIHRLAAFFLVGTTYYLYRERVQFNRVGVLIAALILSLAMFRFASGTLLLPWLGGYLLLAAAFARPVPGTSLVRRVDVSYGNYLYGWPIQQMIISQWMDINPWLLFAISLALSLLAGWFSWHLVEGPAMGKGRPTIFARSPRTVVPSSSPVNAQEYPQGCERQAEPCKM